MKKKIPNNTQSTRENYKEKFLDFRRKLGLELKKIRCPMTRQGPLSLAGIGGMSERPLWSDVRLRWEAATEFVKAMLAYREANPNLYFYMATFIDDCGMTSDRAPVVRLGQIEKKIRRAISNMKADGVGVIEVHPFINYPGGGEGRCLSFHGHAIIWTTTPLDINAVTNRLNASRAWNCALGADPVHIQPINTAEEMERVCYYLFKTPHSAKNVMPNNAKPGRNLIMDTTEGYRGELAVRVLEGLSQVNLTEVIFGVGEGAKIRQVVRSKVEAWHRARPRTGTVLAADFDIWRFWLELRQEFGSKNFLPYRFDSAATPAPASRKPAPLTTGLVNRPVRKRHQRPSKPPPPTRSSSLRAALLAKRRPNRKPKP